MKPQEIGIQHESLSNLRWNLDMALQAVTRTMLRKGLQSGSVSAKIDIVIREITKDDGQIVRMMAMEPDVKAKVGSKENFKCDKLGAMYVQTGENGEVVAGDCQISIDEYLKEQKGA